MKEILLKKEKVKEKEINRCEYREISEQFGVAVPVNLESGFNRLT